MTYQSLLTPYLNENKNSNPFTFIGNLIDPCNEIIFKLFYFALKAFVGSKGDKFSLQDSLPNSNTVLQYDLERRI